MEPWRGGADQCVEQHWRKHCTILCYPPAQSWKAKRTMPASSGRGASGVELASMAARTAGMTTAFT